MEFSSEENEGEANVEIGDLVFVENGDGTVTLTYPSTMPFFLEVDDADADVDISGQIDIVDGTTVYSGTPGDITQSFQVAEMRVALTDIEEHVELDFVVTATDFVGASLSTGDEIISSAFDMTLGSINYDIDVADPIEGNFELDVSIRDLALIGTTTLPAEFASDDPAEFIRNDAYSVDLAASSEATAMTGSFQDSEGSGALDGLFGAGNLSFVLADQAISYEGSLEGSSVNVEAPDFPLPVKVEVESYGYTVALPLAPKEADADFSIGLSIVGLALDDFLWNLFDPAEILARDPATVSFRVDASGGWLLDIFDPEVAASLEGADELPVEVSSATISDLNISAAGAQLTGSGAFTFDNSDLFTFDGFPAPSGAVDLALTGGNALLDNLVQMGLLPA